MPKNADVITKKYISRNDIFADIVNYYVFDGEQKVSAEGLTALSPVEMTLIKNRLGRITGRERIRDILKSVVIKEAGNVIYVLVGVENQTDVHYAMPVRNLLYDALNYASQVSETANGKKRSRKESNIGRSEPESGEVASVNKENTAVSGGEFLSGFGKADKIIPVITITFYWGDEPWDAPRKLSDMFKPDDLEYNKYINDYNLNLIVPSEIKDTEKFRTELNLVIRALALRNNDEAFEKLIKNEEYSAVDMMTADVICEMTKLKRPKQKAGGKIDMCKAVEGIKEKAREEGKREVIFAMIKEGMEDSLILKLCKITREALEEYKEEVLINN
jgi:hypothetical protein